jgi:hypothetical protein
MNTADNTKTTVCGVCDVFGVRGVNGYRAVSIGSGVRCVVATEVVRRGVRKLCGFGSVRGVRGLSSCSWPP